ncbi:MAG: zeta toxin family protein [Patescibacteria group bacterium]|nr:zeta toxin family protein [Patescibacteria group bacterium]MDE2218473.1 zeta toxin family protein [Patescibacteria group bacterium]
MDGTLANCDKAISNIKRSLDKDREVSIFFVYQEPLIAWEFTQKREKIEHRNIPKESFIKEFNDSKENVNKIKKYFGNKIHLNLIIKNYKYNTEQIESDVDNVDRFINKTYNENELNNILYA